MRGFSLPLLSPSVASCLLVHVSLVNTRTCTPLHHFCEHRGLLLSGRFTSTATQFTKLMATLDSGTSDFTSQCSFYDMAIRCSLPPTCSLYSCSSLRLSLPVFSLRRGDKIGTPPSSFIQAPPCVCLSQSLYEVAIRDALPLPPFSLLHPLPVYVCEKENDCTR